MILWGGACQLDLTDPCWQRAFLHTGSLGALHQTDEGVGRNVALGHTSHPY